ncbi:PASTA domain-containing protein [Micromonospora sp. NPDC047557]|uniref:PASTA domain-containing protein n=1 Tax=Micromonospora sp. NPDC047557 TaxID=3364250 RepID=UPI0037115F9D
MTYQPPEQPYPGPQPPPAGYPGFQPSPVPGRRKLGTWAIVGIVVGVVVLLCCGIGVVGAIVGGDSPQATPSASARAVVDGAAPTAAPATPAAPVTTAAAPPSVAPTTKPAPPPAPVTVVMPDLVGLNAAVAQDKLKRLGITTIKLGSGDENDTFVILPENWTVTKQSHKKGAKVALDELVVLTCTKQG